MIAKIQELERNNQDLEKEKVKHDLAILANALEIAQGQGRIKKSRRRDRDTKEKFGGC